MRCPSDFGRDFGIRFSNVVNKDGLETRVMLLLPEDMAFGIVLEN